MMLTAVEERTCSRCRTVKATSEYSAKAHRCRACNAENQANWRARDPERYKARSRRYYSANREEQQRLARERGHAQKFADPIGWMLKHKRANAIRAGIAFELSRSDISIPERCPILGIVLTSVGSGDHDASPSLDRLIPALGYVRGNVAVISNRANRIKCDGSADEHALIAEWARRQGGSR